MTAGWAALNTLREALAIAWPEGDHPEPNVYTEADAALALVQTALEAAEHRVEYGHNDTCDLVLSESENYPCTCGQDKLAAALRAVREGK